jgi:hypothetical protein
MFLVETLATMAAAGNTKGGSITVPLTSCLTGLESAVRQLTIFCFYLQNRLIQTSRKGGKWYNDTSPFSIPWLQLYLLGLHWLLYHSLDKLNKMSMSLGLGRE